MVGIYQKAIVIIIIIAIISIIIIIIIIISCKRSLYNGLCPPPHFRKIILRILRQNCEMYYVILFPMRCM